MCSSDLTTEEPMVESAKGTSQEELEDYETPLGLDEYTKIALTDLEQAVSLREDANGMSPIIADLENDTEIVVVAVEGDWVRTIVGETEGFIYLDDIRAYLMPTEEEEEPAETEEPTEAEEPAEEEAEDPEANMKVTIFTSRKAVMAKGDVVRLTSKLEGFEGYEIRYQWECDKGSGYEAVAGGNAESYSFTLDDETLTWRWRLTVLYR